MTWQKWTAIMICWKYLAPHPGTPALLQAKPVPAADVAMPPFHPPISSRNFDTRAFHYTQEE